MQKLTLLEATRLYSANLGRMLKVYREKPVFVKNNIGTHQNILLAALEMIGMHQNIESSKNNFISSHNNIFTSANHYIGTNNGVE